MSEKKSGRTNVIVNIFINIVYCAILLACIGSITYLGRKLYVQTIGSRNSDKNSETRLEEFKEDSVKYYEEKYGDELKIKDSGFIYIEGISQTKTKDMYLEAEDGTGLIYIEEKNQIYDDRQSKEIEKELKDTVLSGVLRQTAAAYGQTSEDSVVVEKATFNYYGEGRNITGNYYHEFYAGDIEEYVKKEDIRVSGTYIYLLCDRNFETAKFMEDLEIHFKDAFRDFGQSSISVCFLSEECYHLYVEGTYRRPDIDMNDCYARYIIGRDNYSYIQNYIKVAAGIYVTSAEKNLILSDGDVTLEKVMEGKEINHIMEEKLTGGVQTSEEKSTVLYQMIPETPVYRVKFSDEINNYIQEKTYKELKVYMKLVPEEIGVEGILKERIENGTLPQDNELINASLAKQMEEYEAEKEELRKRAREGNAEEPETIKKNELWQECAMYYLPYIYEKGDYGYQCLDIYSEMSDGEMTTLNTENYYVAGYRVKVK